MTCGQMSEQVFPGQVAVWKIKKIALIIWKLFLKLSNLKNFTFCFFYFIFLSQARGDALGEDQTLYNTNKPFYIFTHVVMSYC